MDEKAVEPSSYTSEFGDIRLVALPPSVAADGADGADGEDAEPEDWSADWVDDWYDPAG